MGRATKKSEWVASRPMAAHGDAIARPNPWSVGTLRSWIGPAMVAALGCVLCVWIWSRSGELLLDFGRELYVFWQLSHGKLLYLDLDYHYGPLAPYCNALLMSIFGPSVTTIMVANLLVLSGISILLYRLSRKMADAFTANVAAAFFLVMFGLGSATRLVQYNFLTPYSHDATYGLLLAVAAISFLSRFCHGGGSLRDAAGAGVCTGLSFLTKPEIFIACAGSVAIGLTLAVFLGIGKRRVLAIAPAAAVIPILLAFFAQAVFIPWRIALNGTLGGIQFILNPKAIDNPFFKWGMGTDRLRANAIAMGQSFGLYVLIIVALCGAAFWLRRRPKQTRVCGLIVGLLIALVLALNPPPLGIFWTLIERGLPMVMLLAAVAFGRRLIQIRRSNGPVGKYVVQLSFVVFSSLLLLKMLFFSRSWHYGFVLAAPAGITVVLALVQSLPNLMDRSGGGGIFLKLTCVGLLFGVAAKRLEDTAICLRDRTTIAELASGGTMALIPEDSAATQAIAFLTDGAIPSDATLAVFPDAAGLNFASGKSSSISYSNLNPFEFSLAGEEAVRSALLRTPPDYISFVDTDESAYGKAQFGVDYAESILKWIQVNYSVITVFPDNPGVQGHKLRRIFILKRHT